MQNSRFEIRQFWFAISLAGIVLASGSESSCRNDIRVSVPKPPAKRATAKPHQPAPKSKPETKRRNQTVDDGVTVPTDDTPTDSPAAVQPSNQLPEPSGKSNLGQSLLPNASIAHLADDKSFRLIVTIDGTRLAKETDEYMRLEKGSILICPDRKVAISTPVCSLDLEEGSVVSIDVTSDTTYVRDFHDRWKGHVAIKAGEKTFEIMPGNELIVTREADQKKAWAIAVRPQIMRRGLVQVSTASDMTIFKGDFSIPDAMVKSNLFLLLKDRDEENVKDVIDEVTKTAALLHIMDNGGPFTVMQ